MLNEHYRNTGSPSPFGDNIDALNDTVWLKSGVFTFAQTLLNIDEKNIKIHQGVCHTPWP
jgi:hypothetical protein